MQFFYTFNSGPSLVIEWATAMKAQHAIVLLFIKDGDA